MVNVGFLYYARHSVWDFVLCTIAACGLCQVCLIAFQSTSALQGQPWVTIPVVALITLLLFVIAYRTRTAAVGGVLFAVAACVATLAAWYATGAQSLFADGPNNGAYMVLMLLWPPVLVFLLSRKRVGSIALLVIGFILCALMEYLYWQGQVLAVIVFGVAAAALIAYRNYQMGLAGSATEQLSFGSAAAAGVVVSLVALLLSCGVFALVIGPLDPPQVTLKLITQHVRVQEEHLRGAGDTMSAQNKDLFSMNVSDEQQKANGDNGQMNQQQNQDDSLNVDNQTVADAGGALNIDNKDDEDSGQAISIQVPDYVVFIAIVLVVLIVLAVIALKKLLRARWLAKVRELPAAAQVQGLFLYFMRSLVKMKVPPLTLQTLNEYAVAIEPQTTYFEQTAEACAFTRLAQDYGAVVYGGVQPSDEQLAAFHDYYAAFHRRARAYVGRIKYLLLFFRI